MVCWLCMVSWQIWYLWFDLGQTGSCDCCCCKQAFCPFAWCPVLRRFQDYIEPGDEIEGMSPPLRRPSTTPGEDGGISLDVALPLGEDTLTNNLGLDVVVVITKARLTTQSSFLQFLSRQFWKRAVIFGFIIGRAVIMGLLWLLVT